ncbi:MAG: glycerol-3-phosphate dehydrogenase/oxidase [Gemmatimonadota bacterium]
MRRAEHLGRLRTERFDVLVIGGGITGAAAARDAAARGFRTGLVEARDFGEGTSSRSSRLIHGGLRYLEQFEFDLVFEASRERRTLLRIAPHMVRPLEFLFPVYREGSVGRLKLDAGMWLYDALSLFRNIERHQMLSASDVLWREPGLAPEGLLGGARYFDAQVDDARLVLTTVRAAAKCGAAVANRLEVVRILYEEGEAVGVRVQEKLAEPGEASEWDVRTHLVLNATGPWTDQMLTRAGREAPPLLRPTRGTHIHVRRDRIGHSRALIFESPLDGRIMFVLPWGDLTLIGTTDEEYEGAPEDVRPTGEDVRYLLDSTNRLFPDARLDAADVLSAWAGLRPLVAGEADAEEDEVSRDHVILEEPPGLLTIAGGKLTSHRAMAEEIVDLAESRLSERGIRARAEAETAGMPLPGGDFEDLEELERTLQSRMAALGLDRGVCERLARAYGTLADEVLELVSERPELRERLVEDRPYIAADAVQSARREMALHVEDVAFRRTHVGLETEEFGAAIRRIAVLMRDELGWDEAREQAEIARAEAVRERNELFRSELEALEAPGGSEGP